MFGRGWTGAHWRIALATCVMVATAMSAAAQGTKIALMNVQEAISRTGEGQKLIRQLEEKYRPRQDDLQAKQDKVAQLRDQLQRGANTMSDEARRNLTREIQRAETDLQREAEDARGEFNQEQGALFNSVGQKIMDVINSHATEKGYEIIMDISNQQSPILFAVNALNITDAIIAAYDAAHPADGAAAPAE